jgi:hypothetical protein
MQNITWYVNRLQLMTTQEIHTRLKKTIQDSFQKYGFGLAANPPRYILNRNFSFWFHTDMKPQPQKAYIEQAKLVIDGHIPIFSIQNAQLGKKVEWNQDPLSRVLAPKTFGKKLDYRDPDVVGDIKYLWELNRHLHLVSLGQAYALTQDFQYLAGLKSHLQSWLEQCTYALGPNWSSPLESGIRLINWSILWQFIGGPDSELFENRTGTEFLDAWLQSIYQHCHFIQSNHSTCSSANNHLIGEAAGLFIATLTWPFWQDFHTWQEEAKELLERECIEQTYYDGVNKEQTTAYMQFVLDFLLLSALAGRQNKVEFSKEYWMRIEAMLECIASFMDKNGNIPMIGDGDDGYVLCVSLEKQFSPFKSLLATGAALFHRQDFKSKSMHFDHKSLYLLGKEGLQSFQSIQANFNRLPIRTNFPAGGYFILGKDFETTREVKIIFDCGPLGYLSIAAHGHADALSIYLSLSGLEFLIDPGTYAYHTKQKWRNYFRGTSAHNTLRVDGLDQSVIGGNFMWIKKAKAGCQLFETDSNADHVIGWHDGYMRLKDPLLHTRKLSLDKDLNIFFVEDALRCIGRHHVERFWHFSEKCSVWQDKECLWAENQGVRICLQSIDGQMELVKGQESPPRGWISRNFDHKEPSWTALASNEINGNTTLRTVIKLFA